MFMYQYWYRYKHKNRKRYINGFKFTTHHQAAECCVKQVTEAAAAVVGQERRDGFVRARVHSRQQMPMFKTKKDMLATFL